ncbi:MAG TPA: AI-2E family transporter, partial [Actinobacteria bacterium]|nr:AI-2E family transporter [Actinomycetota bacterium]
MSEPTYERIRRLGIAAWSLVGTAILIAILVWLIIKVQIIWPPLILAVILVYIFKPFVDWLATRGLPRLVGGCLSYIGFGGLLVLFGFLVLPEIAAQGRELVERFPEVIVSISDWLSRLADSVGVGVDVRPRLDEMSDAIREWFADPANQQVIVETLSRAGQIALGVAEILLIVLLAPVLAFYILMDAPALKEAAQRLVPPALADEVAHVGRQVARAVGGFVRGQLLVAFIVGVLSSISLYILDLPFWLVVGMTAGFLNIIPFIGPWVGGALGLTSALIAGEPTKAIWVVATFFAIQQLDNQLISPMVLRVTVKLHPVVIILALLTGGSLAGLFGLLI